MEDQLLLFINGHHNEYFDTLMWTISWKWTWVPLYVALLVALKGTMRWTGVLIFLVAVALTITIADQVCATVIRPLLCRMRPSNPDNPISVLIHIVNEKRGGQYGLPSCHAANAAALVTFMTMHIRSRKFFLVMTLWFVTMCYSRMYMGVHYPTDILLGTFVGCCSAVMCYLLYKRVHNSIYGEPLSTCGQPAALIPMATLGALSIVIILFSFTGIFL